MKPIDFNDLRVGDKITITGTVEWIEQNTVNLAFPVSGPKGDTYITRSFGRGLVPTGTVEQAIKAGDKVYYKGDVNAPADRRRPLLVLAAFEGKLWIEGANVLVLAHLYERVPT